MSFKTTINHRINKFSPTIFDESPYKRNQIVYIPRFMSQLSLPKKLENISEWQRSFNRHKYSLLSPPHIGLPGGAYSRLILIQINTLAKIQKSPEVRIGSNYAEFMRWMGLYPCGGSAGNIAKFKEHFVRCINCVIHSETSKGNSTNYSMTTIINKAEIHSTSDWKWSSKITLSDSFFEESQVSAPTDLGALICLSPGTLRMDIFNFLVSRLFYLKKETLIPWKELHSMFASPGAPANVFKQNFIIALKQTQLFYQDAKVSTTKRGLLLMPSRMLIQPRK